MNELEKTYYKNHFRIDHLEVEPVQPAAKQNFTIEDRKSETTSWERERLSFLKSKYNIPNGILACDGLLGMRLEAKEQSLAHRIIDNDRQRSAGMRLATAKVNYQGQPVRLWVEVTKF